METLVDKDLAAAAERRGKAIADLEAAALAFAAAPQASAASGTLRDAALDFAEAVDGLARAARGLL